MNPLIPMLMIWLGGSSAVFAVAARGRSRAALATAALVFTSWAVSLMWNSAVDGSRHSPHDPYSLPNPQPVDITETFVDRSTRAVTHIESEPMADISIDGANLFRGWPESVEDEPAPIPRRPDGR